jgi:hypothetical protein
MNAVPHYEPTGDEIFDSITRVAAQKRVNHLHAASSACTIVCLAFADIDSGAAKRATIRNPTPAILTLYFFAAERDWP